MRRAIFSTAAFAIVLVTVGCRTTSEIAYEPIPPRSWPTEGWSVSTPEAQGMESAPLVRMMERYEKERAAAAKRGEDIAIDSITVVRNGVVVADLYPNPLFEKDQPHIIHSCTKSVVSALVGIAIEQGHIESVDVPVLDFFADKDLENVDERKKNLTLRHLLAMQTGLDTQDSYLFAWRGLYKMLDSEDWVQHALSLPMDAEPGTRFDYSNISSFLLSAVLTRATGQDTLSFAREHLFAPLGISDVRWETSPDGIHTGWARMWLKPHDMAKLGLLYLQKGRWEAKQVVPARWVEESTRAQANPKAYRYFAAEDGGTDYTTSTGYWVFANLFRPFSDGYGYQWWLDGEGMYTALGHQGQFITVVPEKNLVVVFTGKLIGGASMLPPKLVSDFIVPAVVSDVSLPPNDCAEQHLAAVSTHRNRLGVAHAVPALPATALRVSGTTWALSENPWHTDELRLVFEEGNDTAEISYSTPRGAQRATVGLDGVWRRSKSGEDTVVAKGSWTDAHTFVIEHQVVGYSIQGRWTFRFEGDTVAVSEFGVTGLHEYTGRPRAEP
jgi:CubicO group peptidase (beta-lactamase class C family)